MAEYHVAWAIEVDASSPEDAALKALASLRRPIRPDGAHVFEVMVASQPIADIWRVDLDEGDSEIVGHQEMR